MTNEKRRKLTTKKRRKATLTGKSPKPEVPAQKQPAPDGGGKEVTAGFKAGRDI